MIMETFKRSIVIIDIDGTLYDKFSYDDKKIISKVFEHSFLVKILDKILWAANSLDFISNSMGMLKLRLMIYSILSLQSYSKVTKEYRHRYQNLLLLRIGEKEKILNKLNDMYDVILVTNNVYALNVLYRHHHILYVPNVFSRREQITVLEADNVIEYIIGNNYMDDIFLAKKHKIPCIYVGSSPLKDRYKADYNVLSFDDILEILKSG